MRENFNGRKFIGGTLEVNTGTEMDECIIPIECMQYELKKDGTRNALYDRHLQIHLSMEKEMKMEILRNKH